jgi:DNA-directed RNA polymerase subunit omega
MMLGSVHTLKPEKSKMIEALKDDQIMHKLGGRFKFTALVQHRLRELMDGARPLVERNGRSDFEIAIEEIVEGKIAYELASDREDSDSDELIL